MSGSIFGEPPIAFPTAGFLSRTTALRAGILSSSSPLIRSAEEAALLAARRELLEETGYESDDWTHLITVPSQATLCDNYAYVFAAKNCRKSAAQHLDDMELLNVLSFSPRELDDLIAGGCFQQALHILAWLLFQKEGKD